MNRLIETVLLSTHNMWGGGECMWAHPQYRGRWIKLSQILSYLYFKKAQHDWNFADCAIETQHKH